MATLPFETPETGPRQFQSLGNRENSYTSGASPLYHRMFQSRRTVETYSFDQAYIDRLAAGDADTASHFYNYFCKLLIMKFRARISSSGNAEDIAQTTLFRVLKQIKEKGGIDQAERLGAFVIGVSENVWHEFLRQGGKFLQVPENIADPVERALNPEEEIITEETKQFVRRIISKLNKKEQLLLQKVFLEEQDKDEICAELKITRNYLRVKVCRALDSCRKIIKKEPPPPPGAKNATAA